MFEPNPALRGQKRGERLRALRGHSGMTPRAAAECLDASISKVSRLETGRGDVPVEDVATLLAVYGVRGDQRRDLLALPREADRRGGGSATAPHSPNASARSPPWSPGRTTSWPSNPSSSQDSSKPALHAHPHAGIRLNLHCGGREARSTSPRAKFGALSGVSAGTAGAYRRGGPGTRDRRAGDLPQAARTPRRPCTASEHPHPRRARQGGRAFGPRRIVPGTPTNDWEQRGLLENLTSSLFLEEEAEVTPYRQAAENLFQRQSVDLLAALAQRRKPEDREVSSRDTEADVLA